MLCCVCLYKANWGTHERLCACWRILFLLEEVVAVVVVEGRQARIENAPDWEGEREGAILRRP